MTENTVMILTFQRWPPIVDIRVIIVTSRSLINVTRYFHDRRPLAAVIARNNQISFVADRREIVHHNGTGCAPLLNRNSLRPGYNRKYLPRTGHGCEIVFTSRIGISFGRCYSRGGKAKSAASGIFLRLFTYEFLRAC